MNNMTSTSTVEQSWQTFSLDYGQKFCNKNSGNMALLWKIYSHKRKMKHIGTILFENTPFQEKWTCFAKEAILTLKQ